MICPKCGEVNSSNFLFCGMCGTMLEPARKATAPVPVSAPVVTRAAEARPVTSAPVSSPVAVAPPPAEPPPHTTIREPVPPIGGPSLLGLDQPTADDGRERAFSSLESYDSQSKSRGTRLLLFLLLLAALGGGYWWTYTNYLRVSEGRKPAALPSTTENDENAGTPPVVNSNTGPSETDLPIRSKAAAPAPVVTPEPPAGKGARQTNEQTPVQESTPAPAAARHEVTAPREPATPTEDNGDSLFRQGERYLYGRAGVKDCVKALRYLKLASDKQNAKARSAMGTMYATGHCVSRDLPSAYRWFALSLRADPSNSVVEKNLSSVWNQMTPPERQLATRSQ